MNLNSNLSKTLATLDPAYRASIDATIAQLRSNGMTVRSRKEGDRAPDFALRNHAGALVALSDQYREGPVVLSFFRGEWCRFCQLELRALFDARAAIEELGGRLILLSPQPPTGELQERAGATDGVQVLHDVFNGVALEYGLVFRMPERLRQACLGYGLDLSEIYGTTAWFVPIPATYVVRPDGIIDLAFVEPDFTERLEPRRILDRLQHLQKSN